MFENAKTKKNRKKTTNAKLLNVFSFPPFWNYKIYRQDIVPQSHPPADMKTAKKLVMFQKYKTWFQILCLYVLLSVHPPPHSPPFQRPQPPPQTCCSFQSFVVDNFCIFQFFPFFFNFSAKFVNYISLIKIIVISIQKREKTEKNIIERKYWMSWDAGGTAWGQTSGQIESVQLSECNVNMRRRRVRRKEEWKCKWGKNWKWKRIIDDFVKIKNEEIHLIACSFVINMCVCAFCCPERWVGRRSLTVRPSPRPSSDPAPAEWLSVSVWMCAKSFFN